MVKRPSRSAGLRVGDTRLTLHQKQRAVPGRFGREHLRVSFDELLEQVLGVIWLLVHRDVRVAVPEIDAAHQQRRYAPRPHEPARPALTRAVPTPGLNLDPEPSTPATDQLERPPPRSALSTPVGRHGNRRFRCGSSPTRARRSATPSPGRARRGLHDHDALDGPADRPSPVLAVRRPAGRCRLPRPPAPRRAPRRFGRARHGPPALAEFTAAGHNLGRSTLRTYAVA